MTPLRRVLWTGLIAAFLLAMASPAFPAGRCEDLSKLALPGVSITEAVDTPAGARIPSPPGAPPSSAVLPAHCLVRGVINKRTGSDGKPYGIGFELRLPSEWQGRFLFQGGGGTDGAVLPAVALVMGSSALTRGFAIVSTDAGHEGRDASFGHEQQARLDYAYNALGQVTAVAKQIVTQHYGRAIEHSYFMGCSNGGRQGMMASQRYPLDFDGIIAGDPGFRLSRAAIAEVWDTEAFMSVAPEDGQGHAILSRAFSNSDLALVSKAVLEACDANDGLKDGLIDNTEACRFDPEVLVCKGAKSDTCLSGAQVTALKKIFGGAKDSRGTALYSDWPYDAGIGDMGWRIWKLGTSPTPQPNAINVALGFGAVTNYFVSPSIPNLDLSKFDFDKAASMVSETTAINDPTSTQLSTFTARGGKLLLYHGVSDPVFSVNDTIRYYQRMAEANGGMEHTAAWARLYLIPGMNHCGGGPSLDQFDALGALTDWVEKGSAPDRIVARGASFPGRTRPLCAFPQQPHYKGSGSSDDAANFECK